MVSKSNDIANAAILFLLELLEKKHDASLVSVQGEQECPEYTKGEYTVALK